MDADRALHSLNGASSNLAMPPSAKWMGGPRNRACVQFGGEGWPELLTLKIVKIVANIDLFLLTEYFPINKVTN